MEKVCNALEYWRYYRELNEAQQETVKELILTLSGRLKPADPDVWLEDVDDTLAA